MPTIPEILLGCEAGERETLVRSLPAEWAEAVNRAFAEWAHAGQVCPAGPSTGSGWRTWVVMAGRGFGKTRVGAEWVLEEVRLGAEPLHPRAAPGGPPPHRLRRQGGSPLDHRAACDPPAQGGGGKEGLRIALVAATVDEGRRVMVEGASGILACARAGEVAEWLPSRGELWFAGGALATLYSGANPEGLRGPQHHLAWCDELAKWRHPGAAWDMLQLGLRCGERPRALVTTTPRGGCAALQRILAAEGTVATRGRSRDNPHLPAAFLEAVEAAYGGTRMGREELDGELMADVAGSLWPAGLVERCRGAPPDALRRVVVGVDPPASAGGTCGIVVCGVAADGVAWVLADHSAGGLSPEGWAQKVRAAAEVHAADRVVAEGNQGGEMVTSVLRAAGIVLPLTRVTATRGKVRRAEPVAGLFESGRARFGGRFPALEDELAGLVAGGEYEGAGSPDRADAMVWALTELMLKPRAEPRVHLM